MIYGYGYGHGTRDTYGYGMIDIFDGSMMGIRAIIVMDWRSFFYVYLFIILD